MDNVLDLTDPPPPTDLGLVAEDLVRSDHQLTREIGAAAHEHGFQAILSNSAAGIDQVVAIFPARLAGAVLEANLLGEWNQPDDLLR